MNVKNIKINYFLDIIIVLLIFFFDRISKIIVINLDENSFSDYLFASKFLNIHLIWNKGIAFGLFSFDQDKFYSFLTIFIFVIVLIILFMIFKSRGIKKYALLMIFGGALGNLYDRMSFKAVPDFIDFHIGDLHWFIFNVADIFISIGVIVMIIYELIDNNKNNVDQKY